MVKGSINNNLRAQTGLKNVFNKTAVSKKDRRFFISEQFELLGRGDGCHGLSAREYLHLSELSVGYA